MTYYSFSRKHFTRRDTRESTQTFLGETPYRGSPLCDRFRSCSLVRSFVRHETSFSNISRTVWSRTTKFYQFIHADIVYSQTEYDIIIRFRPEVIAKKKLSKILPPTASGGISGERFKQDYDISHFLRTICLKNLLDMVLLAPSNRLKNATKCGMKVS